ncbi:hypothetical protein ACROYT_G031570 [Oculina patagonica]
MAQDNANTMPGRKDNSTPWNVVQAQVGYNKPQLENLTKMEYKSLQLKGVETMTYKHEYYIGDEDGPNMTEKHLPPLDLTGPASQVAERWCKWKRAFEYYAEGKGIENVRKKTSQLLHFTGMEVQDVFEDLQDPGPVPEEGDNAYKIVIRKLDSYFRVEENIPYERHVFRQLTPQDGETADQFMVRLRKQA